ncbi:hypothetical protein N836_09510 [Leptolyngbya sp. Heron Island J]|uniref:hypothetical protein n=1 Tax=Leptolyngbya sp. Heron Island J TaxID=1385935 RepID=UPI0003B9F863|nr:hypothetical protein [Leptolyngbya sp. Heron Island J]ESA35946.1 hypothetical protein N836_09510 [Leptolyngbya sp. Heron Island J]
MKLEQEVVIGKASRVNSILTTGFALVGLILLIKILGITANFEIFEVELPVKQAWLAFLLLTGAHFWTASNLVSSADFLYESLSAYECNEVFKKIRRTGGLFFEGLKARKLAPNKRTIVMDAGDRTTKVAIAGSILLVLAIIPFEFQTLANFLAFMFVAIEIAFINWVIGSKWVYALSKLAWKRDRPHKEMISSERVIIKPPDEGVFADIDVRGLKWLLPGAVSVPPTGELIKMLLTILLLGAVVILHAVILGLIVLV